MPRLHGLDVHHELKANPATARIPIIVITGTDTSDLSPIDFAYIFTKPTSPETLIVGVETCLRRMPA